MRTTMFGLALLGAAVSAPVLAQTSPAAPDRNPPAAMQDSTRPGSRDMTPADRAGAAVTQDSTRNANPSAAPADRSGATSVGPATESGQRAVTIDQGTRTAATPQPGANSFTEGQARSRIEAAGFSDVTELQKDDQGIWRGRGMRNGQQTSVALDFQGNVTTR